MTFGVHYYDKNGREVTGTQFYKTACEERDAQIAELQEQVSLCFIQGYNQAIADAKALGCKAIKLPPKKMQNIFSGVAVAYRIPCKDAERRDNEWVEALKAQGFTVEGE